MRARNFREYLVLFRGAAGHRMCDWLFAMLQLCDCENNSREQKGTLYSFIRVAFQAERVSNVCSPFVCMCWHYSEHFSLIMLENCYVRRDTAHARNE